MAAAVDDPVWQPRISMTLTSPTEGQGHQGHYTSPGTSYGSHNGQKLTNQPVHYGTYSPRRKPYLDIPVSTSQPQYHDFSQGTWPRSAPRSSQGHTDPPRSTFNPGVPARGSSLHTIREQELEHNPWLPSDDDACGLPPSYDPSGPTPGPSMTNGMSTTVPQNLVQQNLNCSHQPSSARRQTKFSDNCETLEVRCCRMTVLLVIMQICLGVAITALAFYLEQLTSSLLMRECPYWAGIPLMITGVIGLYYCATDFAAYSTSTRAFIIKAVCFVLSSLCIFMCMVAAVFPGLHGHRIVQYSRCDLNGTNFTCTCIKPWYDGYAREFKYNEVDSCVTVMTSVKDYLILQCALNAIASGVCLWFVMLLWKKRYEDFHSGLRFYSYSASLPPHP